MNKCGLRFVFQGKLLLGLFFVSLPGVVFAQSWYDADFVGVWHLDKDSAGAGAANVYDDSTIHTNHGDDYVSATAKDGKILGGQQFGGVDDYIDCGNDASLNVSYLTVQLWLNVTSWGNRRTAIHRQPGPSMEPRKRFFSGTFRASIILTAFSTRSGFRAQPGPRTG